MIDLTKSKAAFEEARKFMPGGVNSPVRSYPHMGCPHPSLLRRKALTSQISMGIPISIT